MKKFISVFGLFLMFSLQVFQLCDETHDACEALSNKIQAITHKDYRYTVPKAVDDPDADLPLVLGQTLNHGRITGQTNLVAQTLASYFSTSGTSFISKIPVPDHSPPWAYFAGTAP